ncbi:twin-arginine translocase subunit TatC, partial [Candidatus Poribacteria bacterium]|nr:twin-arginine translocase subunit TatC [Candidatus Poribacteria bacterium]
MPKPARSDGRTLPFLAHLEELRSRLLVCVLAVLGGCVLGYFVSGQVIDFLIKPVEDSGLLQSGGITLGLMLQPDGTLRVEDSALLRAAAEAAPEEESAAP